VDASSKSATSAQKSNSKKYVTTIGSTMPPNQSMQTWLASSESLPMPISYMLKPITQLFTKQNIRDQLIKAEVDPDTVTTKLLAAYNDYCNSVIKKLDLTVNCSYEFNTKPTILSETRIAGPTKYSDYAAEVLSKNLIGCKSQEALHSLKFSTDTLGATDKIEFTCLKSYKITDKCDVIRADKIYKINDKPVSLLANSPLKCPANMALRSFTSATVPEGKDLQRIEFTCCKAKFEVNTTQSEFKIDYTTDRLKSLIDFNNLTIETKENEVITGIQFVPLSPKMTARVNTGILKDPSPVTIQSKKFRKHKKKLRKFK